MAGTERKPSLRTALLIAIGLPIGLLVLIGGGAYVLTAPSPDAVLLPAHPSVRLTVYGVKGGISKEPLEFRLAEDDEWRSNHKGPPGPDTFALTRRDRYGRQYIPQDAPRLELHAEDIEGAKLWHDYPGDAHFDTYRVEIHMTERGSRRVERFFRRLAAKAYGKDGAAAAKTNGVSLFRLLANSKLEAILAHERELLSKLSVHQLWATNPDLQQLVWETNLADCPEELAREHLAFVVGREPAADAPVHYCSHPLGISQLCKEATRPPGE